ncbi:hypothetical protein BJY01DRAFT_167953 [Aspergillus pseudoustus]|uniref:F-box domain-containing protein n=1 Tax=Aspergillus pseudoustus TaxID=1810923 RepID=A0ABR4K3M0_9EURO
MPTLTSLPLDIQQHIISYLISIRDVAALSTQNKALHRLCDMEMRHMYHSAKIEGNSGSLDIAFDLLLDILRRPALGHYIRHIEVRGREPRRLQYTEREPQRELSVEDTQLLRNAIRKAGFPEEEESRILNMVLQRMDYKGVKFGTITQRRNMDLVFVPQALGALMVSVSPFLESLAMAPMGQHYYTYPGMRPAPKVHYPLDELLRSVNSNPAKHFQYLQNLRSVYIINHPDDMFHDTRFYTSMDFFTPISTICHLPSIESVGTDVLEEDPNGLSSLEPKSSDIAKLAVHHSSVSSSYLVSLICSCKALKDFGYSVGGRASNDGGRPLFSPKRIIQSLLYHKETLEILDLDVDSYIFAFSQHVNEADELRVNDRYDSMDDEGTGRTPPSTLAQQKGSLRDFAALKRLSIGAGFLFYFARGMGEAANPNPNPDDNSDSDPESRFSLIDHLPPNLEHLCIRGYKEGEFPHRDPAIEELVEAIKPGGLELELTGVFETIPNADNVEDPDGQPHLLWRPGKEVSEGETDDEEE